MTSTVGQVGVDDRRVNRSKDLDCRRDKVEYRKKGDETWIYWVAARRRWAHGTIVPHIPDLAPVKISLTTVHPILADKVEKEFKRLLSAVYVYLRHIQVIDKHMQLLALWRPIYPWSNGKFV